MAEKSVKLYAYVYDNSLETYSWQELLTDEGVSRIKDFGSFASTIEDPLNLSGIYTEVGAISVFDHDNYWGSLADETNGLINSSDPVWKTYRNRPVKIVLLADGSVVKTLIACIKDIKIKEKSSSATLEVKSLTARSIDSKADGKTASGNTLYGEWGGTTSPTLFASYVEDTAAKTITKGWFTNRRITDILRKSVYALEEDRFGSPQIGTWNVESDSRFVSMRSCVLSGSDGNGISETLYGMVSDGTDLWIVAGNKLYKYDVSEDTYTAMYTDASETATLQKIFYNNNVGRLFLVRLDGSTTTLIQYTISGGATTTRTLTNCVYTALKDYDNQNGLPVMLLPDLVPGLGIDAGCIFWVGDDGDGTYTYYLYSCREISATWTQYDTGDLPDDDNSNMIIPGGVLVRDGNDIYMTYAGGFQVGAPLNLYQSVFVITHTEVTGIVFTKRWDAYQEPSKKSQYVVGLGVTSSYIIASIRNFSLGAAETFIAYKAKDTDDCWDTELDNWEYGEESDDDNGLYPKLGLTSTPDDSVYFIRNRQNMLARVYEDSGSIYLEDVSTNCFNLGEFGTWEGGRQSGEGIKMIVDRGSSSTYSLYGITAPSKILFQYSKTYSGFIELCNWEGMSIAELRNECSKVMRGQWYYDDDGVFHFVELAVSNGSSVKDFAEGEAISIQSQSDGFDKIINRYTFIPYYITKVAPSVKDFLLNNRYNSTFVIKAPTVLPTNTLTRYWRLVVTDVSGDVATYRIDYLDSGVWTEFGTGYTSDVQAVLGSYLTLPVSMFAGTPKVGDAAFWWTVGAYYDYEKLSFLDMLEIEDSTSITAYDSQEADIDEKFIPRPLAEGAITRWLNKTKDPKATYIARVPYEGNEAILVNGAEISITSEKFGLTSATHFRIISCRWSYQTSQIAVDLTLKQI